MLQPRKLLSSSRNGFGDGHPKTASSLKGQGRRALQNTIVRGWIYRAQHTAVGLLASRLLFLTTKALQLVMTSLRNGTYYISVLLSPPGFLQVDANGNAPVVRRFTGSALQQWQLVLRNSSIYSIQNIQFRTYVSMFDSAGTSGTPLTSSTTEVTWYFRLVGGSYTISHCSCLLNGWKVDLIDSVPTLAPFESTYQGELWNITTVETQSPILSATSTGVSSTPNPFPVIQASSTAVGHTNLVPLTVGLGVGLGVPAIAAIVFLVIYFTNRNKPRGKPINPAFDPSLSSMGTSRERQLI